jgi:hypothetical protein
VALIEPFVGLAYLGIGFILTYLSLEIAWHFTACRIKTSDAKMIKPCLFKQTKLLLAVSNLARKLEFRFL